MCPQHFAQSLVQQVSGRVVAFALDTFLFVDLSRESSGYIFRQFSHQMNRQIVLTLRVNHVDRFAVGNQPTGIADLSTHFRIERSLVQHDLI